MSNKYNMDSSFVVTLSPSHIKGRWLNIPAPYRCLFPDINMTPIILEYEGEPFQTSLRNHPTRAHNLAGWGLTDWFKTHELKKGDKVSFSVIKPMGKYRLEIVN